MCVFTARFTVRQHTPTGDARGVLHVWRAEIKDGQLQPLQLLCRVPPPKGSGGEVTSLQHVPFTKATGSQALLSAHTDGSVCLWDLDTWVRDAVRRIDLG